MGDSPGKPGLPSARKPANRSLPAGLAARFLFVVAVTLIAAAGSAAAEAQQQSERSPQQVTCGADGYCALFKLDAGLTAAAWLGDARMYLAGYGGSIHLLNVESGEIRTVLRDGLSIPQGLTVLDGRLYATDMGNVCDVLPKPGELLESCMRDVTGREIEFHRAAGARILSFRIDPDGGVSDRRVIEDRILSRHRDYGPHGLATDGEYVYVSIGHPQDTVDPEGFYAANAEQLRVDGGRADLMGVIARFRPADEQVRIEAWATGFRNVYGISIAADGTMYGVDNDERSWRQREELNAISAGGFYGFPYWGTNEAPPDAGVTEPVAVLSGVASTAACATRTGVYVAYKDELEGHVIDRFDYDETGAPPARVFSGAPNYVTGILERRGLLYLIDLSGNVHVIEQRGVPIRSRW